MAAQKTDSGLFEKQSLAAHNKYRALHGCPPLKINPKLTAYAKNWAENLSRRGTMEHRKEGKYGENLFLCSGMENLAGDHPVKMWYGEIELYDFQKSEFSPETGHFTQVIWKGTKEVGVAKVKKGKKIWVVANYNPPGNFVGLFKENVPQKI